MTRRVRVVDLRPARYWWIPWANRLGAVCGWLADRCERARYRLEHCPACGENLMYGRSCNEVRDAGEMP